MKPVLQLAGLTFTDRGQKQPILRGCHLKLRAGEFVVLTGASGEGKSTLMAVINGAIPHYRPGQLQGDVLIHSRSLRAMGMAEISRHVGSVLQNAEHQIMHETVEDEIAFGCENLRLPPAEIEGKIRDACRLFKLEPRWETKTLSGGQKQRLITAATLAMGQKILVFDEPLANIDRHGARVLLDALKEKCRQGYAVLFIEHRLDLVRPWADRVLVLHQGKILPEKAAPVAADLPQWASLPSSLPPMIRAENLSLAAGGKKILDDVSFAVGQGRRLLILGDNGSGKTTLLKLLAGLQKPSFGHVHVQSRDRPGFVFQNPDYQLFMPRVDAEIGYQAKSESLAQSLLQSYGLQPLASRHPQALSEGQKRRLGIAAIEAGQPQVLLLDEPTVGQDQRQLDRFFKHLQQWHEQTGLTLVSATHDRRFAQAVAQDVLWLEDGRIKLQGGREVLEQYFSQTAKGGPV